MADYESDNPNSIEINNTQGLNSFVHVCVCVCVFMCVYACAHTGCSTSEANRSAGIKGSQHGLHHSQVSPRTRQGAAGPGEYPSFLLILFLVAIAVVGVIF